MGWIQFNMVSYLQRRNPNVPGIINKLQPPQERKQFDGVHALFESCRKEHVNSDEVLMKLYRPALTKESFYQNLEEILLPVWQSARSLGFREWRYHD